MILFEVVCCSLAGRNLGQRLAAVGETGGEARLVLSVAARRRSPALCVRPTSVRSAPRCVHPTWSAFHPGGGRDRADTHRSPADGRASAPRQMRWLQRRTVHPARTHGLGQGRNDVQGDGAQILARLALELQRTAFEDVQPMIHVSANAGQGAAEVRADELELKRSAPLSFSLSTTSQGSSG